MNCEHFVHQLGTSPTDITGDMHEHALGCQSCAQLMRELREFEQTLKAALDIDVPEYLGVHPGLEDNVVVLPSRASATPVAMRPQWLAVAAVVVLGIGITLGTWYSSLTAPLPQSLVKHVRHEPALLGENWNVVPVADVKQVLQKGRVSLKGDIGTVRHAGLCYFRGNKVAHVVVHTSGGPITVMLLPEVPLQSQQFFDEDGMKGLMVPMGNGSIAVMGENDEAMSKVRQRVTSNVAWSI